MLPDTTIIGLFASCPEETSFDKQLAEIVRIKLILIILARGPTTLRIMIIGIQHIKPQTVYIYIYIHIYIYTRINGSLQRTLSNQRSDLSLVRGRQSVFRIRAKWIG